MGGHRWEINMTKPKPDPIVICEDCQLEPERDFEMRRSKFEAQREDARELRRELARGKP